jgi:hypothetical protein
MLSCRSAQHRVVRGPGVIALILALVHTPLPQPDFHNIRHHDGAGEVCEHHDHLLRWHPTAGADDDVATLHWHWFLPTGEPFDGSTEHAGPAVHAHVVDWQASTWEGGDPLVSADAASRLIGPHEPPTDLAFLALPNASIPAVPVPGDSRVRAFSATFAPSAPLSCLLQHWNC